MKLLTFKELADLLKVNHRTLYRYIQKGIINFGIKVGHFWRFKENDVLNFLNKKKKNELL